MKDNNDLLHKIGNLIDQKLEPVKKDLQDVKQSQAQTNTKVDTLAAGQARIHIGIEALKAGQDDIREKMATKDDIHRLEQKIDKVDKHVKSHESRIDNLEDETGLPNPHKN